ncbi:MAG: peptidylprolyl isomerase [Xanthobacteraceae bacterium]
MRKLTHEPLLHFLLIALAILAIYEVRDPSSSKDGGEIAVSAAKIEQIAGMFARAWQRPPTAQEMKGLIDEHVREEVLNREALTRGLDKDDPTIRRRLRLKMEYLFDLEDSALQPSPSQLADYFKTHKGRYETESEFSFEQVYFNPKRRGDQIDADAAAAIIQLTAGTTSDPATLGDATLLPFSTPLSSRQATERTFGDGFAAALDDAPVGVWAGPYVSAFGLHVVRLTEKKPPRVPDLSEIRETVARDWIADEKKKLQDERLVKLLKQYKVRIELPPKAEQ